MAKTSSPSSSASLASSRRSRIRCWGLMPAGRSAKVARPSSMVKSIVAQLVAGATTWSGGRGREEDEGLQAGGDQARRRVAEPLGQRATVLAVQREHRLRRRVHRHGTVLHDGGGA